MGRIEMVCLSEFFYKVFGASAADSVEVLGSRHDFRGPVMVGEGAG